LGEHERAFLVYRATVDASFYKDAPLGGALEQADEFMGSVDFMKRLWSEYPDSAPVVDAYFALAQKVYTPSRARGMVM
jgi:alpha-2-macroglobulin